MLMSRKWKRDLGLSTPASCREAPDLEFFRGEVGRRDRPDVLDDADPQAVPTTKLKAFSDVGLVEAMSRERWGAAKWVRSQTRMWVFNDHEPAGQPPASVRLRRRQCG